MRLFVLGPAGCGKSSFVKSFSSYLGEMGLEAKCVNLDPATDPIFETDADIRKFVKTEEVMEGYNLGINGALIKSVELGLKYVEELRVSSDYVLYDTPGQMELLYTHQVVEDLLTCFLIKRLLDSF